MLIMEHFTFGSLEDVKHTYPLSAKEAATVLIHILEALAYVHDQGVTHRDIKPGNILVAQRMQLQVKLADFGLAKEGLSLNTQTGTVGYMAPEADGYTRYTTAVDIWSLGVVTLEVAGVLRDDVEGDRRNCAEWAKLIVHQAKDRRGDRLISFLRSHMLQTDPKFRLTAAGCLQEASREGIEPYELTIAEITGMRHIGRPPTSSEISPGNEHPNQHLLPPNTPRPAQVADNADRPAETAIRDPPGRSLFHSLFNETSGSEHAADDMLNAAEAVADGPEEGSSSQAPVSARKVTAAKSPIQKSSTRPTVRSLQAKSRRLASERSEVLASISITPSGVPVPEFIHSVLPRAIRLRELVGAEIWRFSGAA